MDYSRPVSSVHRISQARIWEWVAIFFSRDLPILGIELVSPALAGRFFTTEPPGKLLLKIWSMGEENGKPLQYSCLENPMNSMKRQNDRILKKELPRSVGAQYATGDQWRNNSRKNEGMEPKQKQYPVVDGTGDISKVRCCEEQYYIGTWDVRSMNQGKLELVKQEMARVNVNILGISELNGLEWVNLTQMTIIYTTVGRNPLEEME